MYCKRIYDCNEKFCLLIYEVPWTRDPGSNLPPYSPSLWKCHLHVKDPMTLDCVRKSMFL